MGGAEAERTPSEDYTCSYLTKRWMQGSRQPMSLSSGDELRQHPYIESFTAQERGK